MANAVIKAADHKTDGAARLQCGPRMRFSGLKPGWGALHNAWEYLRGVIGFGQQYTPQENRQRTV